MSIYLCHWLPLYRFLSLCICLSRRLCLRQQRLRKPLPGFISSAFTLKGHCCKVSVRVRVTVRVWFRVVLCFWLGFALGFGLHDGLGLSMGFGSGYGKG
jgi:hypothetical protein